MSTSLLTESGRCDFFDLLMSGLCHVMCFGQWNMSKGDEHPSEGLRRDKKVLCFIHVDPQRKNI